MSPSFRAWKDLKTLSRRPVTVLPCSDGTISPLNASNARSWLIERLLFAADSKAAAPATCGVAIEVPLSDPYVLAGSVLKIAVPGAPISTECAPKFEKLASASVLVVAATEIIFGKE